MLKVIDDTSTIRLNQLISCHHDFIIIYKRHASAIYTLTSTRNTHYQWSALLGDTYYDDYKSVREALTDVPVQDIFVFASHSELAKWLLESGVE